MKNTLKKQQAFTLFELLIAMSIIAILLGIVVPSFTSMIQQNSTTSKVNSLFSDLRWARTEAIKQHVSVAVCASSDQTSCSGSTDWSTGWIVFTDQNNNGAFNDDFDSVICETAEDCVLKIGEAASQMTMLSTTNSAIIFDSRGSAKDNQAASPITIIPDDCPTGMERYYTIGILEIGKTTKVRSACP